MGILDKIGLKRGNDDIDDFINMPTTGPGYGAMGPAGSVDTMGFNSGGSIDTLPSPSSLPSTSASSNSNQLLVNKIDLLSNKIDTLRSQLDMITQKITELENSLNKQRTQQTTAPTQQQSSGYGQQPSSFGGFNTQQQSQPQQQENWQSPW